MSKVSGYTLDSLMLINFAGREKDILGQFSALEINEDLFAPVCHGTIKLMDAVDLQQEFPIIGEEQLRIKYKTSETDEFIERTFYIFEMNNRTRVNNAFEFELSFASKEYITNKVATVSKSWKEQEASKIVSSIFEELDSNRKTFFDKTDVNMSYIAPMLTPIQSILQISTRVKAAPYYGSSFVFYEDADGFHFTSIEKLMEREPKKYSMIPSGATSQPAAGRLTNIMQIEFASQTNELDLIQNGMYGSLLMTIDPLTRQVDEKSFNYFNEFKKFKHLETNGVHFGSKEFPWKSDIHTAVTKSCISTKNRKSLPSNGTFEASWVTKEDTLQQRLSQLQQYTNKIRVRIMVSGTSTLRVGDVLDLAIPSNSPNDKEEANPELDKYLSGKYIATTVKHAFTGTSMFTFVELIKDCYRDDYSNEFREEFFGK